MPSNQPLHSEVPTIAVLLATYNGRQWLPDQLDSILAQRDVSVTVFALDDGSSDGTVEWLAERSSDEPRLVVLHGAGGSGSAAGNFFRLVARADVSPTQLVAFADQDDLWLPDKFARHAALLRQGYDGISSSITSFDERGRRTLVRKSYPQREFDYLTESPGPGSTFLMSPRLFAKVRAVLADDPLAAQADFHDSLVYAVARSSGLRWCIDPVPTVNYRQHDHNVMGANLGSASALSRFTLMRTKWHRSQAILHARVGLGVAPAAMEPGLERMLTLMTTPGIRARLELARGAGSLRRRPRDRWIIGLLIAFGIW
jgi:rhamnosyltransferase